MALTRERAAGRCLVQLAIAGFEWQNVTETMGPKVLLAWFDARAVIGLLRFCDRPEWLVLMSWHLRRTSYQASCTTMLEDEKKWVGIAHARRIGTEG